MATNPEGSPRIFAFQRAVRECEGLSRAAVTVGLVLSGYMDSVTLRAYPGMARLMRESRYKRSEQVTAALKELKAAGLIEHTVRARKLGQTDEWTGRLPASPHEAFVDSVMEVARRAVSPENPGIDAEGQPATNDRIPASSDLIAEIQSTDISDFFPRKTRTPTPQELPKTETSLRSVSAPAPPSQGIDVVLLPLPLPDDEEPTDLDALKRHYAALLKSLPDAAVGQ